MFCRPYTPNIVIVMTDGQSQDPAKTKEAARRLKAKNVTIFVIGVSKGVAERELIAIASDVSNVYKITDFSSLAAKQTKLQDKLCKSKESSCLIQ